jgi:hypothetical protein
MSRSVKGRRELHWLEFGVTTLTWFVVLSVSLMVVYTNNPEVTYDLSNWIMWYIRH